jgi:hypothetical protein
VIQLLFIIVESGNCGRGKLDKCPVPLYVTNEWTDFLFHNLYYPIAPMENEHQGIVTMAVTFDENGEETDFYYI